MENVINVMLGIWLLNITMMVLLGIGVSMRLRDKYSWWRRHICDDLKNIRSKTE